MTNTPHPPIPTPQDECRQAFERWSQEQGWEISGPEARMRWAVWQGCWNTHARPTPDRGLIEKLEAEWSIENEVYKKTPSSYNEGWVDGFEAAIEIVRHHGTGIGIKTGITQISTIPVKANEIPVVDQAFIVEHIWRLFDQFQSPTIGNRSPSAEAIAKRKAKEVYDKLAPYLRSTEPVSGEPRAEIRTAAQETGAARTATGQPDELTWDAMLRAMEPTAFATIGKHLAGNWPRSQEKIRSAESAVAKSRKKLSAALTVFQSSRRERESGDWRSMESAPKERAIYWVLPNHKNINNDASNIKPHMLMSSRGLIPDLLIPVAWMPCPDAPKINDIEGDQP